MSNLTALQKHLVSLVAGEDAAADTDDSLWSLMRSTNDPKHLEMVKGQIMTAFWDVQSAENTYAGEVANTIKYGQQAQEGIETGAFSISGVDWMFVAAQRANEARAKLEAAVKDFRRAAALYKAMTTDEA